MALTSTYASFVRHRQDDGSYVIIYPINTSDEVYVDINNKVSLTSKLNSVDSVAASNKESIVEDMLTILSSLAPMFKKPILLNHVYVDDFSNDGLTTINITKGIHIPGKIMI